ncbi:MAG: carbohydrate kinase family protein [Clostridia bacterium]|nr:carbohydrate kinase family protein [Clostridia bacterium]
MSKRGITVAGSLIADQFFEIDTYPAQGFLTNVRDKSMNVGGTGNIILDLAKLDKNLTVKACAVIGDDERGVGIREIFSRYPNIDIDNITIEGDSATCMVMNAKDTKQRTFFFISGSSDVFDINYINWDTVDTKIFLLEYLLLLKKVDEFDDEYGTHAARILHEAQKRGMLTSIDIVSEQSERAKTIVKSALKYTDICCINELEAEMVTGIKLETNCKFTSEKMLEAMKKIKEFGVSKWIVIHASDFGYGYDCETEELFYLPSLDVPTEYIKGKNGAGDAYCSGILYAAHEDKSLWEALNLARCCATASLSENNGTDGMRPVGEEINLSNKFPQKA